MTDQPAARASLMPPFEKWELLSKQWMSVKPPAAPSEADASNYVKLLGDGSAGRILMLGCTPTLRRKLSGSAHSLFCADISPGMLARSAEVFPRQPNETFVNTDWFELPLDEATFDAVVGDKVFDNVTPSLWGDWLSAIARVMKPGACFATRISPRGRQALQIPGSAPYEVIVRRWSDRVRRQQVDLEEACSGFWEDALAASTVAHTNQVGDQRISRILPRSRRECLAAYVGSSVERDLIELVLARYWSARNATWTAYSLEGVISAAAPWFSVSALLLAHDYAESRRQPTLGLEKRI